jgi:hypothetical protein
MYTVDQAGKQKPLSTTAFLPPASTVLKHNQSVQRLSAVSTTSQYTVGPDAATEYAIA